MSTMDNGGGFVTEIKSEDEEMINQASEMTYSSDHEDLMDEEPSESPGKPYHIREPVPEEKIEPRVRGLGVWRGNVSLFLQFFS